MAKEPLFATQVVPAATAAKVGATGKRKLMRAILYPAAANSIVEFKNAATDTGDVLLTISAIASGQSVDVDLTSVGGLVFGTALFCKPAGTGAVCYVFYE